MITSVHLTSITHWILTPHLLIAEFNLNTERSTPTI